MVPFNEALITKNRDPKYQAQSRLGDCLKQKRLQKGLTLEEATLGIVSTSYLSKVENNAINADSDSLKLLAQKANLSVKMIDDDVLVDDGIYDAIRLFYDRNLEALITLAESIKDPIFISSKRIMEGFIAVLKKDFTVSKEIIEGLWPRYRALAYNDHLALSLLTMIQSYEMKEYRRGFKISRLMDHLRVDFPEFHFLMNYYGFLIAEAIEKYHFSQRFHHRAKNRSTQLFNYDYQAALSLKYINFLNREDPEFVYETYLKTPMLRVPPHLINLKTLIAMKNALDMGHHCPDIVLNAAHKDDAFYEVKLMNAMEYKQFDDKAFKSVGRFQMIYKRIYELAKLNDPKRRAEFIRQEVLPELHLVYMPKYARMVFQELADYQRSINRYKEANSITKQLAKYLRKIDQD